MAGVIETTITFANGDQVTSAKLNEISTGSSFTSDAITGTTLSVTAGKLKVGTITASEMGTDSVATASIQTGAVTAGKLASDSVTTAKIVDLAVTAAKIAEATITIGKIATSALATTSEMRTSTANKLVQADTVAHAEGVAKCHGVVEITASRALEGSTHYNVASVSRVSATETQVNIDTNMSNANYTVLLAYTETSGGTGLVSVYDKAVGSFKIVHPAEASGRKVNFVVFGRRD